MQEFIAAARKAAEDQDWVEFSIAGQEFKASVPTTGQTALIMAALGNAEIGASERMAEIMAFLDSVLQDDGMKRLRKLMRDGVVPLDMIFGGNEDNDRGIVEFIVSHASDERPTQPSSSSSSSPESTGRRSTGRVRGEGSIPSDSL